MFRQIGYKIMIMLPSSFRNKVARSYLNKKLKKNMKLTVEGIDNVKNVQGPIIFIGNHLSNTDGLVLSKVLSSYDPTFVAGVKLDGTTFTKLGLEIIKTTPIKANTADKEGIKKIINIAKNNGNLVIFPEGTRSRNGKMIKAKRGLYLIAKMTKATIVPVATTGTEILMPINDESMGSETFNPADVTVRIGKPFKLRAQQEDESKKQYEENVVDEAMKEIAKLLPKEYRGVYDITED